MSEPRDSHAHATLVVSDEVLEALSHNAPVVALETAVLTHGLPRESWRTLSKKWPALGSAPPWLDSDRALNRAAMHAMIAAVRGAGAVPAVTAVLQGQIRLGLSESEVESLAGDRQARKVARRDIAASLVDGASGGTTVSASLAMAAAGGVMVFATGGIGGVHRGWQQHPDISADLLALSQHRVCVICSGAKSILDIPATLEALETLSVPVVGFRCDSFPRFVCRADPALAVPVRVESERSVVDHARAHWSLPGGGALLIVQPVKEAEALSDELADRSQKLAEAASTARGAEATPDLLNRVAEETSGASLKANISLLRENAALAAAIACAFRAT